MKTKILIITLICALLGLNSAIAQSPDSVNIQSTSVQKISFGIAGGLVSQIRVARSPGAAGPGNGFPNTTIDFSSRPEVSLFLFTPKTLVHKISLGYLSGNYDQIQSQQDTAFQNPSNLGRVFSFSMSLHYSIVHVFLKEKKTKIRPYIGGGFGVGFSYLHASPLVTSQFERTYSSTTLSPEFVVGALFQPTKHFFLDFSTPLELVGLNFNTARVDDPTNPLNLQSTFEFNNQVNFLNQVKFQLRVAAGYRF